MATTEQADVVAFLSDPGTYSSCDEVKRVDTHVAFVFLCGGRSIKLKRTVRYDYMDFLTVDLRLQACEAEVRINRRTAPTIYHGVLPITRGSDGALRLGGKGSAVD